MQEPETWQNPELFARLQKEAQNLAPLAENYAVWEETCEALAEAQEMLADPEMKDLARDYKEKNTVRDI